MRQHVVLGRVAFQTSAHSGSCLWEPILRGGTLVWNIRSISSNVRPFSSGTYRNAHAVAMAPKPPKTKPTLPFRLASSGLAMYGMTRFMIRPMTPCTAVAQEAVGARREGADVSPRMTKAIAPIVKKYAKAQITVMALIAHRAPFVGTRSRTPIRRSKLVRVTMPQLKTRRRPRVFTVK